ncbi:MAG: F0F1 ATP synthase subunit delta [Pseudomonadota bacterium]
MSDATANAAGLAGRYASALFDLAREQNALDQVAGDLAAVGAALKDNPGLGRSLGNPTVGRQRKIGLLQAIAQQAGLSDLTLKFLGVLATQGRLFALSDMITAFDARASEARGEVTVEVVSAVALDDGQIDEVKRSVGSATGKQVRLLTRVDASLLAGMIVRVGSRMIDASLKTKLRHLEVAMRGAG